MANMKVQIVGTFRDNISPVLNRIRRNIQRTQNAMNRMNSGRVGDGSDGTVNVDASGGGLGFGDIAAANLITNNIGRVSSAFNGLRGALEDISLLSSGVGLHLSRINRAISNLPHSVGRISRSLSAIRELSTDAFKITFDILTGFSKEIIKLSLRIGSAAAGITSSFLLIKGVGVAKSYENLSVQLKTATGSAEEASTAFNFLRDLATELPLNVEELTNAFVKMKNLGLSPTRESLISFTNTAAANGKSLMQFVEAVADASVGEFERLKEFGIKASSQGDKVAFTFRNNTVTIGKNATEITEYLEKIGNTQFAGAATEQMETLDGKISNLKVSFDELANRFVEETRLFSGIKSLIDLLTGFGNHSQSVFLKIRLAAAAFGFGLQSMFINLKHGLLLIFEGLVTGISKIWEVNINYLLLKRINFFIDMLNEIIELSNKIPGMNLPTIPSLKPVDFTSDNLQMIDEILKGQEEQLKLAKEHWDGFAEFATEEEITYKEKIRLSKTYNNELHKQKKVQEELSKKEKERLKYEKDLAEQRKKLNEENWLIAEERRNEVKELGQGIQDVFTTFFEDIMSGSKNAFENLFGNFKSMIDRMVAEALAAKVVRALFGDMVLSGSYGGLFGGGLQKGTMRLFGRENGGPVQAGLPYIVGEKRPELFVPNQNGNIVPDLNALGGSTTVNINAIDARSVAQFIDDNKFAFAQAVNNTNKRYNIG